jgi:hypothetical protein
MKFLILFNILTLCFSYYIKIDDLSRFSKDNKLKAFQKNALMEYCKPLKAEIPDEGIYIPLT